LEFAAFCGVLVIAGADSGGVKVESFSGLLLLLLHLDDGDEVGCCCWRWLAVAVVWWRRARALLSRDENLV
jgi:hypothetical protein